MNYTVYETLTGEIQWSGDCLDSDFEALYVPENCSLLALKSSSIDQYVRLSDESIQNKEDYEFDSLPLPCVLVIDEIRYEIDSVPKFNFPVPGEYLIEVDAGPAFYNKRFIYDAN